MKPSASMSAQLVNVRVREGKAGLFYATSTDLRGLLVAEPTLDALERALPGAITDLFRASGHLMIVTKLDIANQEGLTAWVAFPAEVAQSELRRRSEAS